MRLFAQVFCYTTGVAAILAGLAVVAFVGYELASVVDVKLASVVDVSEQLALAWITSALLFTIFGVLLVGIGLALRPPEQPK